MKALTLAVVLSLAACGGSGSLPPPDLAPEPIALRLEGVLTERTEDMGTLAMTLYADTDTFDLGTLALPLDTGYAEGSKIAFEPWADGAGEPAKPVPADEHLLFFAGQWYAGGGEYISVTHAGNLVRVRRLVEDEGMEGAPEWTAVTDVAVPEGAELRPAGDGEAP